MTSQLFPMRVAVQNRHRKPAGYRIRIVGRAGDRDTRVSSPRSSIWSINVNLPAYQSAAVFPTSGSVIAAFLPRLRRLAARTLERFVPLVCARALAAIFSRIRRDIRPGLLNFCRHFGSGKPSFLRVAFVNDCRQPANRIRSTFQFAPISPSVVVHMSNSDRRKRQGVVT